MLTDRYCINCGIQTATTEMVFEIGTAMGVSEAVRIEELNSLSECNKCREIRIYESVHEEMDREQGIYLCKHGFVDGEECPLCEHVDGAHAEELEYEPEYPCPYCENPNISSKDAEVWFKKVMGKVGVDAN